MQYLARNFASQLKETITKDKLVYMGKADDGELLTVRSLSLETL